MREPRWNYQMSASPAPESLTLPDRGGVDTRASPRCRYRDVRRTWLRSYGRRRAVSACGGREDGSVLGVPEQGRAPQRGDRSRRRRVGRPDSRGRPLREAARETGSTWRFRRCALKRIKERPEIFRVLLVVLAERTQIDEEAREALRRFYDSAHSALVDGIQESVGNILPAEGANSACSATSCCR